MTYNTSWDEFTNNFASDLAPIIALFGESATKQFLSESTSFWDNVIFGLAPLGILTAIVSVVRVYGTSSMKSFIGRSQESHGMAEAELCSSTSHDVCELWSHGGICRVFGRPNILEFMYDKPAGSKEFYPKYRGSENGEVKTESESQTAGIRIPRFELQGFGSRATRSSASGWRELPGRGTRPGHNPESSLEDFATYPNLTLNIGIRTGDKRRWRADLLLATLAGTVVQLGFFGYATWATFYHPEFYDKSGSPPPWSFVLAVAGTLLLVVGMIMSAWMIDRKSRERLFVNDKRGTRIFWLQPGNQRIGDQLFNPFAYDEVKLNYITSMRLLPGTHQHFIKHHILVLCTTVGFSVLGWICQFAGLRGLHGTIAFYQLGATLFMAAVRALLRGNRLGAEQNRLRNIENVEGHERDWQALHIGRQCQHSKLSVDDSSRAEESDGIERNSLSEAGMTGTENSRTGGCSGNFWFISDDVDQADMESRAPLGFPDGVEMLEPPSSTMLRLVGFRNKSEPINPGQRGSMSAACANSAIEWTMSGEETKHDDNGECSEKGEVFPSHAAQVMHFRTRLSLLTIGWKTETRSMALKLKAAIESAADYVFFQVPLHSGWHDAVALAWSTACHESLPSEAKELTTTPIHFHMYKSNGRWRIDESQLEAVLGLWQWSLKRLNKTGDQNLKVFAKKRLVVPARRKQAAISAIRMWVTPTDVPEETSRSAFQVQEDLGFPEASKIPEKVGVQKQTQKRKTSGVRMPRENQIFPELPTTRKGYETVTSSGHTSISSNFELSTMRKYQKARKARKGKRTSDSSDCSEDSETSADLYASEDPKTLENPESTGFWDVLENFNSSKRREVLRGHESLIQDNSNSSQDLEDLEVSEDRDISDDFSGKGKHILRNRKILTSKRIQWNSNSSQDLEGPEVSEGWNFSRNFGTPKSRSAETRRRRIRILDDFEDLNSEYPRIERYQKTRIARGLIMDAASSDDSDSSADAQPSTNAVHPTGANELYDLDNGRSLEELPMSQRHQILPVLTLPISVYLKTKHRHSSENEQTPSVILAIDSNSSELQIVAQDIFATFFSRIVDIMEYLEAP
jgi:hypothetical protein